MNDIENNGLSPLVYKVAWLELYHCLGERQQQDEMDLMDGVLEEVKLDMKEDIERFRLNEILRLFPHLDRGED